MSVSIDIVPVLSDNYSYMVVNMGCAAVVDPAAAGPVMDCVNRLEVRLSSILITHNHSDHTAGCQEIKKETGCTIVGPGHSRRAPADRSVGEGDVAVVGDSTFEVMSVPGHTLEDVAYYSPDDEIVFTGDTLFLAGCGRLFAGNSEQMLTSLHRLRALPGGTRVYCGHEYTLENLEFAAHLEADNDDIRQRLQDTRDTMQRGEPTVPGTIREEKLTNPFLRCDDSCLQEAVGMADRDPVDVFEEIRAQKDRW